MSLHFGILVNGGLIGYVTIRRMDLLKTGQPSHYHATVEYPMDTTREVEVEHHYPDGALVLIAKVLMAVGGGR